MMRDSPLGHVFDVPIMFYLGGPPIVECAVSSSDLVHGPGALNHGWQHRRMCSPPAVALVVAVAMGQWGKQATLAGWGQYVQAACWPW
eukprot:CAMPEP_0174382928 /NCGR_PEP_ID=MMETSP0811_2-20130205/124896_1 /TAXON_ID=73025 ORGANISM="Eutreptiella gymnastica-like, Strain CCMP1594" /NCGR_SAMPLE_ID=MMETSP0811_2 /ASSEMBLY_ACC=CAM_ASM_000667 /LENGTH=87 /DNA_ID=CAMNT_0015536349 /DNA_START=792 /DNA_END=1052 /DNA_ORIENTATION=-